MGGGRTWHGAGGLTLVWEAANKIGLLRGQSLRRGPQQHGLPFSSMWMCMGTCILQQACEGQRATLGVDSISLLFTVVHCSSSVVQASVVQAS